jgi:hypothetical protein
MLAPNNKYDPAFWGWLALSAMTSAAQFSGDNLQAVTYSDLAACNHIDVQST